MNKVLLSNYNSKWIDRKIIRSQGGDSVHKYNDLNLVSFPTKFYIKMISDLY